MTTSVPRAAFAARTFTAAALIALGVLVGGSTLRGALFGAAIAVGITLLGAAVRWPEGRLALLEAAAIAAATVSMAHHGDGIVPYLAIPPLVAGLASGARGVWRVLALEIVMLTVGALMFVPDVERVDAGRALLWLVTGLGLGTLGSSVRAASVESDNHESYRDALSLIRRLHALSGKLTDGLDAVSVAESLMDQAALALPVRRSVILTRSSGGTLSALRYTRGGTPTSMSDAESLARAAWDRADPQITGTTATIPLRAKDGDVVGVLVAECWRPPDPEETQRLAQALSPAALRLSASLLFGEVRDRATAEERARLAREMHDGVAQDVASLGYLIDGIAPSDEEQNQHLQTLRGEVSRVVGELRTSVFEIRNEATSVGSLGESISTFAQHVGTTSDLTVHVTLDETSTRLRPEAEAELLRIAQEAINNARKHARARNLWVSCTVAPPQAEIVISDDGQGLQQRRTDSHGLSIIGERAERIGARLEVTSPKDDNGGTEVRVSISAQRS